MPTLARFVVFLVALLPLAAHAAPEPFFAPAVPSGSIDVQLRPTEGVPAGSSRRITFGVPFPRGSLTVAQLANVRVMRHGVEIAAHVEQLTPWRHRLTPSLDGTSVRIVLIQLERSLPVAFPAFDTITVEWGGPARTLNVPTLQDPRGSWHTVNSGLYVTADGVTEPDVYAVLPSFWLVNGGLSSVRKRAFDATNTPARDNPTTMDATAHWPAFQEAERAHKNNTYTEVWRDDPSVPTSLYPQFRTDREPWLYDRSATIFALYERSGSFFALREAVQAGQYYAARTDANGSFSLAPGDTKYTYNECLAYIYWLTGDPQMPAKIAAASTGQSGFGHVWSSGIGFWTERHAAFKLLGKVIAYEVLGTTPRANEVTQILSDFRTHQNGTPPIPANRIDGGLYHLGSQHDGDWADASYGASSWMSALLSDAVVRAYATGEDLATAQFLARFGAFLRATVRITADNDYGGTLASPRYAMLADGSDGNVDTSDAEHALDVAAQVAWGDYFARVAGTPNPQLAAMANSLYATYDESVNFWIRPTAPPANTQFRVAPPRKWGWEHRTSGGIGFALSDIIPGETPLFANGFE